MSQHWPGQWCLRVIDDLPSLGQNCLRFLGEQTDELFAVGLVDVGTGQGTLTQKVFIVRNHTTVSQIDRGYGPIGVLSHDDETLFGAQYMHRLSAERRHVELLSRFHHCFPDLSSVIRVYVDFVSQLPGEADAEQTSRHAGYRAFPQAHERKVVVGEV